MTDGPTPPVTTPDATPARAVEWIYSGVWAVLVGWFRVPDRPPEPPAAAGETHDSFRPSVGLLRYLKFWFWLVSLLVDVFLLVMWVVILVEEPLVAVLLAPVFLFFAVAPDVVAYVAIHLRFDTTWYVMTDRSIRIRRGIWIIHETTVTFDNVQNVEVRQGPVQRMYGIANVSIETAGGSSSQQKGATVSNLALIEGVADAERIRDRVLVRMRHGRTTGLGDEPEHTGAGFAPEHVAALREIRDAIAAM